MLENPDSLPYPFLVECYLPVNRLITTPTSKSARCIADIHRLAVPEDHDLQIHHDPGPAILEESCFWAEAYLN